MIVVKNYMEEIVLESLDKVIECCGGCDCEICRMDILAVALNSLPPKYIATEKGQLYSKVSILQQQFDVDVVSAIARAVDIVKKNPRHNKKKDAEA